MHARAQYTYTCMHAHNTHTHARTRTIHMQTHIHNTHTASTNFFHIQTHYAPQKGKKKKKTVLKIVFGEYGAVTTNTTIRNTLSPMHCTQHVTLQTPCLQCEWLFNEANSKLDVKLGAIFHQHVREHCVYTPTTVKLESTL